MFEQNNNLKSKNFQLQIPYIQVYLKNFKNYRNYLKICKFLLICPRAKQEEITFMCQTNCAVVNLYFSIQNID